MTQNELDILDIYNLSPDLLCVACSRTGKFLQVNDSFTRLLGHSRDTLLATAFIDFVHPDDVASTLDIAFHMSEGNLAAYFFENRYRTSAGTYVSIAWGARAKKGKLYATAKDVSAIRGDPSTLNEIEKLTKTGSWTLRTQDLALTWTEEMYMIHELELGTPVDLEMAVHFFVEEDKITFQTGVNRCLTDKIAFDSEFRITTNLGTPAWVRCVCRCICDAEQNIVEVRGTVQDITFLKNKELILRQTMEHLEQQKILLAVEHELTATSEQLNVQKSEFIANMSHEMRTPLAAIIGFVEQLQSDPTNAKEYLSIISRNATHLSTLVDDVLDLSKVEAGQLSLDIRTVDLETELDEAIAMLQPQAVHKGLVIRKFYDRSQLHLVQTDARRLQQILINIIANAIKFTASGYIDFEVRTSPQDSEGRPEHFVIAITDTGRGIAANLHEHIFERFHQGAPTTNRAYGGTGIGLALSRKLATLLGGSIICQNSTVDVGSTFELRLPAEKHAAMAESASKNVANGHPPLLAVKNPLAGLKILLIDDAPDIRLLLSLLLMSLGAEIELAEDGAIGVQKALACNFDAIIMDIKMPVMNGRLATQKIREYGLHTPIIALSADATKEEKRLSFVAGVNEYCSKPISVDDLNRVVLKWTHNYCGITGQI